MTYDPVRELHLNLKHSNPIKFQWRETSKWSRIKYALNPLHIWEQSNDRLLIISVFGGVMIAFTLIFKMGF